MNVLGSLAVVCAAPGMLASIHLTTLAVAALAYRPPQPSPQVGGVRFLVLIPARNEEKVIGETLAAIARDSPSSTTILVVADRCTDATAEIGRAHGALVLERPFDAVPGRSAARQAGLEYARDLEWDAVVMIDADSVVAPGFFTACERMLSTADVLQARSEAAPGPSLAAQASVAAFALQGVLIPRGRDRLGLCVRLFGSGMLLRRHLAERYAFHAAASEDLVYGLDLCLDGIVPRYVNDARLRSQSASTWRHAKGQRVRWEAGRIAAAHSYVAPLLRRRNVQALEAAVHLITPPFALAAVSLITGGILALWAGWYAVVWVSSALLTALVIDIVIALLMVRAGPRTWAALAFAPWYLLWKCVVQVRAVLSLRHKDLLHAATPRE